MADKLSQSDFLRLLKQRIEETTNSGRLIVAIAGAPASGKSWLSEYLAKQLNASVAGVAAVLPMDGYHYDDELLSQNGWLAEKGAPHTFDVGGFLSMLARLRQNTEKSIVAPKFDRALEISRAGSILIPQSTKLIIVEGNYLLLNEEPWRQLSNMFDVTTLVTIDEAKLESRLRQRWESFDLDVAEIHRKVHENDLPNGKLVYEKSQIPNYFIAEKD